MKLLTLDQLKADLKDKRIVIVGSGPGGLENTYSNIESYDIIIRVNNYKTKGIDIKGRPFDYTMQLGNRIDYHYSFYGGSIRTTAADLKGIKAHLCKCPNDVCHVTQWHIENKMTQGGDFRPIYRRRQDFWVAPVYIPEKKHYMNAFTMLNNHVPTTGFACIWEISQMDFAELYITGFDFFSSGKHNIDELWRPGKKDDPVGHQPEMERKWVYNFYAKNLDRIKLDNKLKKVFNIGK